ncbi:MAG: DUF445 domain-containing protein [Pseudomonadales bacterium]|nr:DUF445 domain-containing protein [Pseudomonadales bacterium]
MHLKDLTVSEQEKTVELAKMKRLATGLLCLMTIIFVVSHYFHDEYTWVGFIEATAEAAMIGAIADWFAVTALFRHPLSIKIPHTAIIPNRKDAIAEQFGEFVQQNFLSEDLISKKVQSMDLSRRVAAWLSESKNANAVAEQMTAGLAGVVRVMNDNEIQSLIERKVEDKIRTTSFAPLIGDLLSFISSGRRQQEMFNAFANIGLNLLEVGDKDIKETIETQTPWWFPGSLDKAIYKKIIRSVSKSLYEMQVDIYHPMRVRMIEMSNEFMEELKSSEDIKQKEITIKEDLLKEPAIRDFTQSLWKDIKQSLLEQSQNPDAELKKAIHDAVIHFSDSILEDDSLAKKIDGWADDSARYLIQNFGHEVANLISQTIEDWDPNAASERIELQIGKDLQFIRINGTVVGGLAGLIIYSITYLLSL